MLNHDRYWQAKRVTLIGALINALLGIIKLIGGALFHSHALVADGIHSLSDLITDMMVLFASKYGSLGADTTHPYGHQRIETAATLLLALLLVLAGAGIAWDAVNELMYPDKAIPGKIALVIALFSIFANELLFHYTRHVGKLIESPLIIANAWHHRSDAASSVVVALGLVGSLWGFTYLDAVAAIIVGLMIIKMGIAYGWNSVKELVDTAVDAEMLAKIEKNIQQVNGVKKIHQLRSRLMGGDIFIDVHVLVDPFISVSEGHYIAQHVHHALMKQLTRVKDVTVHIDPEDDEISCPSLHLRNRRQLEKEILKPWQQAHPGIKDWTLHYLDGRLIIDLMVDETNHDQSALADTLRAALASHPEIKEIRVLLYHEVIAYESA
ncbi:cation transporter [Legionella taurinensis]|uniref:Cation transporter n=1 Tax=Legionella taurinensis TaxID=70611 RepID=A0A3A5LC27_9GAMM|nr:cation diffusion facilitator family transporter [Legionella taurinensis]MDX1837753.1 cation diffusion facilitator family transporter [Legionella taurinensis]PUT40033.1 cation transporter [Legionella taurinensis]PUT43799.1 cation transporter [Legionella taurinensis]PUT46068.1 cation transporter [Legionella taurinensis]PUT47954.1 cation transporter [Legionella taurinensis]